MPKKGSRYLQSGEVSNRLRVSEDGSSAHCELVGLLPFDSTLDFLSYESALGMKLAIQHLNEGNGSLVSELNGLPGSCPITFSASFADTRRNPSHAFSAVDELTTTSSNHLSIPPSVFPSNSTTFVANPQIPSSQDAVTETATPASTSLPCAFVGGIDSRISITTSMVTGLRGFPQISPASTSSTLSDNDQFPLFGRTTPDDSFAAETFVRLLHDTMGVRHVFVIFESHPYTQSILTNLRDAIVRLGWAPERDMNETAAKNAMYVEDRIITTPKSSKQLVSEDMLRDAIDALKVSEFRFVVALVTKDLIADHLMQRAYDNGVAGTPDGSYHWWFFETLEGALTGRPFAKDSDLAKAYNGVGNVAQAIDKTGFKYKKFRQQSSELKRQLYLQHDKDDETGLFGPGIPFFNESEWFQEGKDLTFPYTLFSYDATVLLGLSACRAISGTPSSLFLSGTDYHETIKQTNFTGITGDIVLDSETGSRDGHSVRYTITNWNLIDDDSNESNTTMFKPTVTYVYEPGGDENWEEFNPYIFSGGKTIDTLGQYPDLPPLVTTYKNVDLWVQLVAAVICAVILILTIVCAIWVARNKKSRVVRASQPGFLLLILLGTGTMAFAMIPASLEHCDYVQGMAVCNSYFGLLIIGFGITFSTFLAKTYRINKIMNSAKRFRRVKISTRDTIYPVAIVYSFNVIVFALMVIFNPIVHDTQVSEVDRFGRPVEFFFTCNISQSMPYISTMACFNFVVVCLALVQAWRARNLSTEFAESRFIANVLMITAIVMVFSVPLFFLVDENSNADTFIHSVAIAMVCGSIIGFIFGPKMVMFYKAERSPKDSRSTTIKSDFSLNSSDPRGSGNLGDRILTTKSPQALALENKNLERELALARKEGDDLKIENTALRKRINELTGIDESTGTNGQTGVSKESWVQAVSEMEENSDSMIH